MSRHTTNMGFPLQENTFNPCHFDTQNRRKCSITNKTSAIKLTTAVIYVVTFPGGDKANAK